MAKCNFSRLSVLVVEESSFIRNIIVAIMRGLGVGRIHTANNGREAVEMLRVFSAETVGGAYCPVDLVICEREMSELDGVMMLRWIRRNERSPDPFMPAIMAGFADREAIVAARDAGVTEFVAKPFSLNVLAGRLLNVIDCPRQYVMTQDYFGPDRRRQVLPHPGEENRLLSDRDVQVYMAGPKGLQVEGEGERKVRLFRFPNRLKAKLGGQPGEAFQLDAALIEATCAELQNMENDYVDWARELLGRMEAWHRQAKVGDAHAIFHFESIGATARELSGQGKLFDYPLLTQVGQSLYQCSLNAGASHTRMLELVDVHLDSIRAIMAQRVKGQGGEIGENLIRGLETAKTKHMAKAA